MTERPRKSIPQPKAPKKDEHGCLIGAEVYDAEKGKCVPIVKPTKVGSGTFHEKKAWEDYQKRKEEKAVDEYLKKHNIKLEKNRR